MSRRASGLTTTLSKLASIADSCILSERRPALRRLLLQVQPASDWRQVAALAVRVAMPRKSDVCVGLVAMVGLLCGWC